MMAYYKPYYNNYNIIGNFGSYGKGIAVDRNRNDDQYRKRTRQEDDSHRKHQKKQRKHSSHRSRSASGERTRPEWDDENRHYIVLLGESLTPRYKILSVMGEGTFGKVVECWDREQRKYVAVKIIRAIEKYRDAAMIEIDVLEALKKHDPHNRQPCIQLLSWFEFRGHVCMVFDKYGLSLYDFLRKNHYRAFTIDIIRHLAYQLLHSVAFIHSLTLIHTDLKPENILLVNSEYTLIESCPDSPASRSSKSSDSPPFRIPKCTDIKLIDFGSATFDSHYHTTVVSTRHYRAPEVILGMGWTYPCDIWSIGCILVELYTGDALFQTHENREHLAMMERVFGPFPQSMIDRADRHSRKYFRGGRVVLTPSGEADEASKASVEHVERLRQLSELIRPQDSDFLNLLERLLDCDPDTRITALEALRSPFFDSIRDSMKVSPFSAPSSPSSFITSRRSRQPRSDDD